MTRAPLVSLSGGESRRASSAAVRANPSMVGVGETGSFTFQSTCDSFHDGLGFSVHWETMWKLGTCGLLASILQSTSGLGDGLNGNAGSHPIMDATGPAGLLNCDKPSSGWSGYPFFLQ